MGTGILLRSQTRCPGGERDDNNNRLNPFGSKSFPSRGWNHPGLLESPPPSITQTHSLGSSLPASQNKPDFRRNQLKQRLLERSQRCQAIPIHPKAGGKEQIPKGKSQRRRAGVWEPPSSVMPAPPNPSGAAGEGREADVIQAGSFSITSGSLRGDTGDPKGWESSAPAVESSPGIRTEAGALPSPSRTRWRGSSLNSNVIPAAGMPGSRLKIPPGPLEEL